MKVVSSNYINLFFFRLFCFIQKSIATGDTLPLSSNSILKISCSQNSQCFFLPNSICSPDNRCECVPAFLFDGKQCVLANNDAPEASNATICAPNEVSKQGECYLRKKPGEFCQFSEQCVDAGPAQFYCIASLCQIPPECPPGSAGVGPECFPFAVTGGACTHPIQCLSGSICIHGKCRGPCDDDQLFVGDQCIDYEGAGCISTSCVEHKCPRSFPACNYVPQKEDYLCCDRSIKSAVQCPHPSSSPQTDTLTGEIYTCMRNPCAPGFSCQFSIHGRGSYICCSNPPITTTKLHRRRPNFKRKGDKRKWTPKSSAALLLNHCCSDRGCRAEHPQFNLLCDRLYNKLPLD